MVVMVRKSVVVVCSGRGFFANGVGGWCRLIVVASGLVMS